MASLTKDRDTRRREGVNFAHPVAAGARIYAGALVLNSATGFARPGGLVVGLVTLGVSTESVDNSDGEDGDVTVETRRGLFRFDNSTAGDLITRADIGKQAWVVDDATVAKTGAIVSSAATRSVAGIIRDVEPTGVWVEV